jgi:hypothetical protein
VGRAHGPARAVLVARARDGGGWLHSRAPVGVALGAPGVVAGVDAAARTAPAPCQSPHRRGRQRDCSKTARCRKPREIHRCLRGASRRGGWARPPHATFSVSTQRATPGVPLPMPTLPRDLRTRTSSPPSICDRIAGQRCERALIVGRRRVNARSFA